MEDITSLFNYRDPRSMMADSYASQYQALSGTPQQMIVQNAANAGSLLGNALFGGKTSAMAEQSVLNEAIKESEVAEDPDERLSLFANSLRKRGLEGYAQKVDAQLQGRIKTRTDAQSAQQQQMALTKLVMSKTGLSQEEAAALAKDPATVRQLLQEAQAKVSTFGQQLLDAGFKQGTPEYQAKMNQFINNELTPKKSIGDQIAAGLTPLVGALAKGQATKAGEAGGTEIGKASAKVGAGYRSLDAISDALETVESGIYGGGYGPLLEATAKYTFGVVGNQDRLVNTEAFRAYIGNVVIPMMQQLGGSDSNEELKKMESIAGGNTKLEPAAINRILKSARKAIKNDLARLEKQQEAVTGGQPLPLGPVGSQDTPRATKKYNPATNKLEKIKER
jgi:hypothetical protein